MSRPRDSEEGERPDSSSNRQPSRRSDAPLVIVSERGRHSDESRRIVRAQAARASAAQSRVTRARNREGRGSGSSGPQSPPATEDVPPPVTTPEETARSSYLGTITRPFGNPFSSRPQQHNAPQPASQPLEPPPQQPPQQAQPSEQEQREYVATPPPSSNLNPLNLPLNIVTQKPLVTWLATLLNVSATQLFTNPYAIPSIAGHTLFGVTNTLTSTGAFAGGALGSVAGAVQETTGSAFGRIFSTATGTSQTGGGFGSAVPGTISTPGGGTTDPGALQLPRALPRGFGVLNQRIPLSDPLLGLLTRTSCFDFGSPGVEERIHGLLFDLIIGYFKAAFSPLAPSGPPVQDHLRIACTCLTIFQGQRANGAVFAHEPKYDRGLEAAWSEVTLLDQQALADSRSAEASLWAVFIISVTTGTQDSMGNFFHRLLQGLFQDLQLQYWDQVRRILLDFIYPVSFLDEPCKAFWEKVQGVGDGAGAVPVVS